jgi:hypothetical protein
MAEEIFASSPQRAFAVTVGGTSFEMSEELSEPVRAAIPEAVKEIKELLDGKSKAFGGGVRGCSADE